MTVTVFRARGVAGVAAVSRTPHPAQKLAPSSAARPHLGHDVTARLYAGDGALARGSARRTSAGSGGPRSEAAVGPPRIDPTRVRADQNSAAAYHSGLERARLVLGDV